MDIASTEDSVYDRVLRYLFFSGDVSPGAKVVEKKLAEHLGVSRIPIRESLGKMAGQGLLVGEQNGQGVRLRKYTLEEIRQLYEMREILEGGAARAAARAATDTDIARMQMICAQSERVDVAFRSKTWADLDQAFHIALADASHNDRIAQALKHLLTECYYNVFRLPSPNPKPKISRVEAANHLKGVVADHRMLLRHICDGDIEKAEEKARADMRTAGARYIEALIANSLET